jgi:predicted XRE-type DNA-binding protein
MSDREQTRLTEDQAWEIYQIAWHTDLSQAEIGDMYGIRRGRVSNIKHGYVWNFEEPWIGKIISEQ